MKCKNIDLKEEMGRDELSEWPGGYIGFFYIKQ